MTETKKTNTTYTELEIAHALAHMDDSKRDILCSNLNLNELKIMANNDENFTDYLISVENHGKAYMLYAETLKDFHRKLNAPQSVQSWISDVGRIYRGLSTQDKVKFTREMTANGNLESSVEILKNYWGKLISDIIGVK